MTIPALRVSLCLTAADYQEVVAIRRRVFVEEQGVPAALELDAHETTAQFFLVRQGDAALGTGRMRVKGVFLKIERVATLPESRGLGVGRALMRQMQEYGRREYPQHLQLLHAQLAAVAFYEKLGWLRLGELFYEAQIPHYLMIAPPLSSEEQAALLAFAPQGADVDPVTLALVRGALVG